MDAEVLIEVLTTEAPANTIEMSKGETLQAAAIGMGIVFLALACLILVMWLLARVTKLLDKRTAKAIDAPPANVPVTATMVPAPGSLGDVDLHGVDDKTAAMIMAIVADELKTPLNELRFHSIREKE